MRSFAPRLFALSLLLCAGTYSAPARAASAPGSASTLLITAVYFNPFIAGESSEAIQIQNIGASPITIGGWTLTDNEGAVSFPPGAALTAHQKLWAAKSASAFRGEFGFAPAYEYGADADPNVPNLTGSAPSLGNSGDEVILKNDALQVADAMAYGNGSVPAPDWNGAAVTTYALSGSEGQILYRKQRESDGLPVDDTNTASDWAQDTGDNFLGKRVQYPGWDLDPSPDSAGFFQTARATETATVKYCVAPDQLFECYRDEILTATRALSIETYELNNASIVDVLTHTIASGVTVKLLLDSRVLGDQGKWACAQIEKPRGAQSQYHGECWLMAARSWANVARRYDYLHGKWTIVDDRKLLVGSENLNSDPMPADDKSDGTLGARGGYLVTDSPTLLARAQAVMARDFDPANHADIRRWGTSANDFPPPGFAPNYGSGGTEYRVQFPNPLALTGNFVLEMVQCPENCLRTSDALLGLVARAGAGDTLLVEQLYEHKYWGASSSNPSADPNLRLEAYIDAARRGARVRILLDSFYDYFSDKRSNYETCRYVNALSELYRIECRLGNPTGRGIHNKMVLLKTGATGFVHLGSINGSETSSKLNREVATQVEAAAAYQYWASVFDYDWAVAAFAPRDIWLPLNLYQSAP